MVFGRGRRSAVAALIGERDPEPVRFDLHEQRLREVQEQEEATRQLPIPVAPPGSEGSEFSYADAVDLLYADVDRYGSCA